MKENCCAGSAGAWYEVIDSVSSVPDAGEVRVFGLRSCRDAGEADAAERCLLGDISSDEAFVARLCALFNRCGVSTQHLRDVVLDCIP